MARPVHIYESTVVDADTGVALQLLSLPSRSILPRSVLATPEVVMEMLKIEPLSAIRTRSELDEAVSYLVEYAETPVEISKRALPPTLQPWDNETPVTLIGEPPSVDRATVNELVREAIVPTEQSPLQGTPLSELVGHASAGSVGAVLGYQAAPHSPLLLITVPAGIVLVGAAKGLGAGLNAGLRGLVERQLLGVKKQKKAVKKKKD
jgi:hypothetical protein